MNENFDPPPRGLSALAIVGGILTAILAIAGLQYLSRSLEPSANNSGKSPESATEEKTQTLNLEDYLSALALADLKSMKLPGKPIPENAETVAIAIPTVDKTTLKVAEYAWRYFKANMNPETGLVNAVDQFPIVTMWDQSAAMAAMVSAKEFGLITTKEFEKSMSKTLDTLAKLKLYNGELPNKVYNSQTLEPTDYNILDVTQEIGWSAIDLGRMAIWLKIVGARYPKLKAQTEAVWNSWDVKRLIKNGQMYGTSVSKDGKESYYQEGRLGYENYAAYGFKLWGLKVDKALDSTDKAEFVSLYGVNIPYDKRDYDKTEANNYVLSEPYFLDGIETGFKSLPKSYSDNILNAQQARFEATGQLTALTEDNLDREPYFLYNTLFVNGHPWSSITDTSKNYNNFRFLSTKAAIGWHSLYNSKYTEQLYKFVLENLRFDGGWYGGYYESLKEPNTSLTANNNGVILECLLYQKVKKPLLVWAGVEQ